MKKDKKILSAIVLFAILVRLLFLWVGRPVFVGWFNHTYYYYVEVRGLLEQGVLPYNDMPLLFYIYAFVAKLLVGMGLEVDSAIVASTRLCMSIVPSLIPIPVYAVVAGIRGERPFGKNQWATAQQTMLGRSQPECSGPQAAFAIRQLCPGSRLDETQ